jgi:hypothetical protein
MVFKWIDWQGSIQIGSGFFSFYTFEVSYILGHTIEYSVTDPTQKHLLYMPIVYKKIDKIKFNRELTIHCIEY